MTELYQLVPGLNREGSSFTVRRINGKPFQPPLTFPVEVVKSHRAQVTRALELIADGYQEVGEFQLDRGAMTLMIDTTGTTKTRYESAVSFTARLVLFESSSATQQNRFVILDVQSLIQ